MRACVKCRTLVENTAATCPNCGGGAFMEAQAAGPGGVGASGGRSICERCGFIGELEKKTPGSTGAQVTLFILGLITFGIVLIVWAGYVLWRVVKTEAVCPSCGSAKTMVALSSPLGRTLQARFAAGAPPAPGESPALVDPGAGEGTGRKCCPYCAETIKSAAVICRFCGKELDRAVSKPAGGARLTGERGAASPLLVAALSVVALVLVLVVGAAIGGARVSSQAKDSSNVIEAKTKVQRIADGVSDFKALSGRYPTAREGIKLLIDRSFIRPNSADGKLRDPWGREYIYVFPGEVHPESFDVMTYGADGQRGGEGVNADIVN